MKKQRFQLIFIDAFAGAGRSKIRDAWDGADEEDVLLLDDDFIAAEDAVRTGREPCKYRRRTTRGV